MRLEDRIKEIKNQAMAEYQEWMKAEEEEYQKIRAEHAKWLAFIDAKGGICGAKTRAGTPCKQKALYHSGRCKLHGGLSTGPSTPEGKARSALNGKLGGRPKNQSP